jgi:predicted ATPase
MRGRLVCEQGDFDTGLSEMRAGHALWLSTGSMVSRPLYLALQAEGLMLAGHHAEAAACVDEGLEIIDRHGERQLEAELHRLRGELALQRGERSKAEAWFKRAYALAIRRHRLGFALRSATSLAALWAADGREARARRLLVPLVARWNEGRATRDVRAALALCASLAAQAEPAE